jgi:hypothetical protein
MLLLLSISCGANSHPATLKCAAPEFPVPPTIEGGLCGDSICLSIKETLELSVYQARVEETRSALLGCSLINWKDK